MWIAAPASKGATWRRAADRSGIGCAADALSSLREGRSGDIIGCSASLAAAADLALDTLECVRTNQHGSNQGSILSLPGIQNQHH